MPDTSPLSIGAPIIGGVIGAVTSAQAQNQANLAAQAAVQNWISINIPDPQQQQLALQQYQQTGTFTPAMEQAVKANPTSFNQIATNPQLQSAQMNALQQLQNEGMTGGLTLADQATLQNQLNNTAASARGRNDAIMNQFAQQGLGGSGLQLQAQLQNAQNATQNQGMNSLQAAADARQRALSSIMGAGQLGGQLQQQQYGQQANLARAQDAINMFNTQNSQAVQNQNVGQQNAAQQYNLGVQQQLANANTGLMNQQQQYNKQLLQQQFQNQMQKASGQSNAQLGQANYLNQQAANQAGMWAGVGSGLGKLAQGYGQSQNGGGTTNNYYGQNGGSGDYGTTGQGPISNADAYGAQLKQNQDEEEY